MIDRCADGRCYAHEGDDCAAGEPRHAECHHWQIGQLTAECQKSREIMREMLGIDSVAVDGPVLRDLLYSMQGEVDPASDDAASVAISICAVEHLLRYEPGVDATGEKPGHV